MLKMTSDIYNTAIEYYETCQRNLGKKFKIEVQSNIKNITGYFKAWSKVSVNCYEILMRKFPYGIIYSIEKDFILIIAIMNLHKTPYYWNKRL